MRKATFALVGRAIAGCGGTVAILNTLPQPAADLAKVKKCAF